MAFILEKPRIIVFFEIFFRKFWHLIKLNMLFIVFNLPVIVVMPFISHFFCIGWLKVELLF